MPTFSQELQILLLANLFLQIFQIMNTKWSVEQIQADAYRF